MNHLFTDSTPDRFATDISYHRSCWTEHVLRNLNKRLEDSHSQNINIDDARKMFFRHVDEVIFRNREFFLSGFLFTNIHESQGCRGRGRTFL